MVIVDKEREIDSSISIADLVLIELMKSDDDFGEFHTSVDMNVPSEVKRKFRKDSKTWLPRLIAERAAWYCERKQNLEPEALRSRIKSWLYSFVFCAVAILIVVVLFHAIGTTRWLFSSDHNEKSIGSLMWLLVIPPLLCILPFVACVALLLRGRRAVTDGSESRLSKTARQFSIPGLIGGAWHVWHDLSGRQKSRVTRSLERNRDVAGCGGWAAEGVQ